MNTYKCRAYCYIPELGKVLIKVIETGTTEKEEKYSLIDLSSNYDLYMELRHEYEVLNKGTYYLIDPSIKVFNYKRVINGKTTIVIPLSHNSRLEEYESKYDVNLVCEFIRMGIEKPDSRRMKQIMNLILHCGDLHITIDEESKECEFGHNRALSFPYMNDLILKFHSGSVFYLDHARPVIGAYVLLIDIMAERSDNNEENN